FVRRVNEAVDYGATEICMQSGIHPDWGLEDYEGWLRLAKEVAPQVHLHAYSPMEVAHMSDVSGLPPRAVFERLREAGLDSTPGTAAEVLHDGVRERISPNKLPVGRWVEVIEASHAEGLRWGVNDLGGTLMEENISRLAGSYHGVRLDPPELIAAAHRAGRPAAERTTLYGIRRRYELPVAA